MVCWVWNVDDGTKHDKTIDHEKIFYNFACNILFMNAQKYYLFDTTSNLLIRQLFLDTSDIKILF